MTFSAYSFANSTSVLSRKREHDRICILCGVQSVCIQEKNTPANLLEFMIDPIAHHHGIPLQQLEKQVPQFRNIPLTVSQLVDGSVYCILSIYFEVLVESRVRALHRQIASKDDKWLLKRRNDCLEEWTRYDPPLPFIAGRAIC